MKLTNIQFGKNGKHHYKKHLHCIVRVNVTERQITLSLLAVC